MMPGEHLDVGCNRVGGLDVGGAGDRADAGLRQGHRAEASLVTRDDVDHGLARRQRQFELEQWSSCSGSG